MGSRGPKRQKTANAPSDTEFLENNYCTVLVTVDARKLKKTANPVRSLNKQHPSVAKYLAMFKRGEYGGGENYISVALPGLEGAAMEELVEKLKSVSLGERNLHAEEPITEGLKAHLEQSDVVLVDGAHRLVALEDEEVREVHPFPTAKLYYRDQGKPFSELDVQSVGRTLNKYSSTVVQMSLGNSVESILSPHKDYRGE